MKKIGALLLALGLLCGGLSVHAANGDVIGTVYSTDILACINGRPVPSYNIGGRTVILAEDLGASCYGIRFGYDGSQRLLTLELQYTEPSPAAGEGVQRGTPGQVLGPVYETDIRFLLNGKEIQGYNIGGRTAFCIEDAGELAGSANAAYGYSDYLCSYVWDEDARAIELRTFLNTLPASLKKAEGFSYTRAGNQLYAAYRPLEKWVWWDTLIPSADDGPDTLQPLYLTIEDGSQVREEPIGLLYGRYACAMDPDGLEGMLRQLTPAPMPHDAAVDYLTGLEGYTEIGRRENGFYTVLILQKDGAPATHPTIYSVRRWGGICLLGDYSDDSNAGRTLTVSELQEDNVVYIREYPHTDPHGKTVTLNMSCPLDGMPHI